MTHVFLWCRFVRSFGVDISRSNQASRVLAFAREPMLCRYGTVYAHLAMLMNEHLIVSTVLTSLCSHVSIPSLFVFSMSFTDMSKSGEIIHFWYSERAESQSMVRHTLGWVDENNLYMFDAPGWQAVGG